MGFDDAADGDVNCARDKESQDVVVWARLEWMRFFTALRMTSNPGCGVLADAADEMRRILDGTRTRRCARVIYFTTRVRKFGYV